MTVKDKHGYKYLTYKYSQFNELALACNMNSAQIAEDLAVQEILKVDPSTVRRWRRNEHPVPPIVRRRMEKIAEWVYNLSLDRNHGISMPPAAARLRRALYHQRSIAYVNARVEEELAALFAMQDKGLETRSLLLTRGAIQRLKEMAEESPHLFEPA